MADTVRVTVTGQPGEKFQIWYRGDREADPEVVSDPAPIVAEGEIGEDGRATVEVPRAYLVFGRPVKRGAMPLPLYDEEGDSITVALPPEK